MADEPQKPTPPPGGPIEMVALVYHTIGPDTVHQENDVYTVDDWDLAQTLIGCGFARPTVWPPPV